MRKYMLKNLKKPVIENCLKVVLLIGYQLYQGRKKREEKEGIKKKLSNRKMIPLPVA